MDLLIKNARLLDVENGIIRTANIGIKGDAFFSVNVQIPKEQGKYRNVIDCTGKYIVPGLIDSHTHLELSLLSAVPFAEAVVPQGTTTAIIDCHDFVNVLGMKGLELLIEESKKTPLRSFFMVPPCVPSAIEFEDSGATIQFEDVKKALSLPKVLGLAEVMDIHRVLRGEKELQKMIRFANHKNKIIDGHCPALPVEDEKEYFKLSGAKTDHESVSVKEILGKLNRSVWISLRQTSLGRKYSYKKIFEKEGTSQKVMLCSDGCLTPNDILDSGHIAGFIRELISEKINPVKAIQAATINPAICYGLENKLGSIKKGKKADFLILSDLKEFKVESVFIGGKEIVEKKFPRFNFPSYSLNTIKVKTPSRSQLSVVIPESLKHSQKVSIYVIKLEENSLLTKKTICSLRNNSGLLKPDVKRDILKVVVIERYGMGIPPVIGFVSGFGLREGAFGGSIGQDSQNIVIIGCNDDDIITVARAIKKNQGGIFYSRGNQVLSLLRLPVGGIMSSQTPTTVEKKIRNMNSILRENGCKVSAPYLTLSLQITLPVIPELKITNRGLLDVNRRKFLNLFKKLNNN